MKKAFLGFGILLLVLGWAVSRHFPPPPLAPQPTTAWSHLTLPDDQGKNQTLGQWPGLRLINFWAPWCTPCREELPLLRQIYPHWRERGVTFIGIAMDSAESVNAFLAKQPLPYPSLIAKDDTLSLTQSLGNAQQGLPMTLLLNAHDEVLWVKLGRLNAAELETILSQQATKNTLKPSPIRPN